ncbi:hypothetical protein AB7281_04190 [Providencia rettgeri]|uniref:hypothetical protein n=1 Tax=Providencia sp. PROV182 TaxID=2949885 RepID=UPI0023492F65|nr:hypothetical protein [Providencia sp. PROV182]
MLEPPKSYNELLPMLHKATFITTLIFYLSLVIFGYIPLVGINAKYIPPIKDYEEIIKWVLTFGVLPVAFSIFWSVISGALDLHNNIAKIIKVRYVWDNQYIIKPLAKIAGVTRKLNKDESYNVLSKLYYPEVKEIKDKHYVELFWNKVYYFWVFFEHTVIAFITASIISISKFFCLFVITGSLLYLWVWILFLIMFNFLIFIASVKPRTESQVRQIPENKVKDFFKKNQIK